MHVTSSPAIWYAARASGVAAYVVLSSVVCLGLTLGGKAGNSDQLHIAYFRFFFAIVQVEKCSL